MRARLLLAAALWGALAPGSARGSELDLSGRKLRRLPPGALRDAKLERVNLGGNALSSLPKELFRLKGLRSLNLSGNRLAALPAEIGSLRSLEYLGLAGNPIASLPESLGRLESLSILDLRETGLASVPAEAFPLLRRGAAALVSSATVRPGQAAFDALEARHILRETRHGYTITLGLPRAPARKPARREHLFLRVEPESALYDPSLNYGAMNGVIPCSREERVPSSPEVVSLPEKERMRWLKRSCPRTLFAHALSGSERLAVKNLLAQPRSCCGAPCLRVLAEHRPPADRPLFYSTAPGGRKAAVERLKAALASELPPWVKLAPLPVPSGFTPIRAKYFKYQEPEAEAYLCHLQAEGVYLSEPEEDPVTATWGTWQAVIWIDRYGSRLLTPPWPAAQRAYGPSLEPLGAYDVDGDGARDLLLGQPVSLVLERYADGFRSWGFPPPLAAACPEAP